MNAKIATLTASALLAIATLSGCGASVPAEKAAEVAPAASQASSATTTPSATPKPSQAFVAPAVARVPEDPETLAAFAALKDCSMVKFNHDLWTAISTKDTVPAPHQDLAKRYVTVIDKKGAELGCK